MSVELSNDQKISIINQHLTNLAYSAYNIELSIEESKVVSTPDTANIAALQSQLEDVNKQVAALNAEMQSIQTPSSN
jgi:predicted  nucleic acid-binding Zn-ribbon protein